MQAYFQYLKNVLGINQVLLRASQIKVIVWVEDLRLLNAEEMTLLQNMMNATKIPLSDYQILDLSDRGQSFDHNVIEFELVKNPQDPITQTYSPQVLHQNKNLKAQAWSFLQSIVQKYKSMS